MNNISLLQNKYDISKMAKAISIFPAQLKYILENYSDWVPEKSYSGLSNILILGMGGSAIGGDFARVLTKDECKIPIFVNRNYTIPGWVDANTLVIASSYSGGTEETLEGFLECIKRNTPCIIISTGGKLTELGEKYNLDIIKIPTGYQPRAALGYSVMAVLFALQKSGYISLKVIEQISQSIVSLKKYSQRMRKIDGKNPALELAKNIHTTIPVIYGSVDAISIAAVRFRVQLEENAKMIAFHHDMPEMNHNEIEGWNRNKSFFDNMSIVWIMDEDDHPQISKRIKISKDLLDKKCSQQYIINTDGNNFIERILKLIHFVDWVSYFAALLNKVDPSPVNQIQQLKKRLKKD